MNIRTAITIIVLSSPFGATYGSEWDYSQCSSLSPVNSENVSESQLHSLFKNVVSKCKSEGNDGVFTYLTKNIKSNIFKSAKDKKEYASMYCRYFLRTNDILDEQPKNGIHSITMDKGRKSGCGHPQSYWMIHTNTEDKERVFRLKLAYEGKELRINDH